MNNFDLAHQALNNEQKKAVDTIEGPVMVVAGPGTGKTQTLAMRIANILRQTDESPSSILALTFTEAGTMAMKNRLKDLIGQASYYVPVMTFHSFCSQVIKENPELFPFSLSKSPISDLQKNKIIKTIISSLDLSLLRPLAAPDLYINSIISAISDLKREGYTPADFAILVNKEYQNHTITKDDLPRTKLIIKEKNIAKNKELIEVYEQYELTLRQNKDFDFDDMVAYVAKEFSNNKDLLLCYQEQYHYFLVDEYQDTNASQNIVVDLLSSYWGENSNIFVVGDPNQCIMRFQGASLENVLSFHAKYPHATTITLNQSYRSPQNILDAAHSLIPSSSQLKAVNKITSKLNHFKFASGQEELHYLATSIKNLISQQTSPSDIAIIYRNNNSAQEIADVMDQYNIKYHLQKGSDITKYPVIKQLINLIKLTVELRTGIDDLTIFTVLHYPYFSINHLDILKISRYASSQRISIWEVLIDETKLNEATVRDISPITKFCHSILEWQKTDSTSTITDLLETIIHTSGLLDYILKSQNSQATISSINIFFDEIKKMNSENHALSAQTLIEDLMLMQNLGIKITDSSRIKNNDEITLTTAHSAKGLEWDHVYIYKAIDTVYGNNKSIKLLTLPSGIIKNQSLDKLDKDDDERRLFYVAITRARKSCVITSSDCYTQGGTTKESIPTMFIGEVGSHLIPTTNKTQIIVNNNYATIQNISPPQPKDEQEFLSAIISDFKLSPTSLNTFLDCAYKFKLNSLLKIPRAKAAYLAFGTAVHKALEIMYRNLTDHGSLPSINQIALFFEEALKKEVMTKNDFRKYLKKGKEVLSNYYAQYHTEFQPAIFTEKYFGYNHHKIFLDDIELTGKIDRIEIINQAQKTVRVIDYKTGKPKTKNQLLGKTKNSSTSYYRQLVFYKLLAELDKKFLYEVAEGQLDFVEKDSGGKMHRQTFVITDDEVDLLKGTIRQVTKQIRNYAFDKTKDKKICETCDLYNHCWG